MRLGCASFSDPLRFANWLDNGPPTGDRGGSTGDGRAYSITEQGIADNIITRNTEASIFLTS